MSNPPIIVGVDDSDAAPRAVALANTFAAALGASCRLVHAVRSPWASTPAPDVSQVEALEAAALSAAHNRVTAALKDHVPPALLSGLTVRLGRPAVQLRDVGDETEAQLIVIGGKRHSTFGRWFGSSTGHGLARLADRPVLVTGPSIAPVRRILAAVDFSEIGKSVLAAAERYARAFHAELRVVSVIEPLPVTPGVTTIIDADDYYHWAEKQLTADVWPLVTYPGADKVVRVGHPVEVLLRELTDWAADLVILGSHGRNAVERALLGSVSESLLNQLPASLLLVPPGKRAPVRARALESQLAGAP
ncbi:MAG TPA: universal stress protein [Gemmatimonadales bacterium]|nr:universal stress protein [Gemmatimonadales bacterium]